MTAETLDRVTVADREIPQKKAYAVERARFPLVLKLFDPLLDGEGAGTVLPISITGTRDNPRFAADIKRAILR